MYLLYENETGETLQHEQHTAIGHVGIGAGELGIGGHQIRRIEPY
jgi:hypothetical protein